MRELEATMDAAEFAEWLAFEQLYGLADGHMVTGQVCATVARSFAGAKVGPGDFAPVYKTQGVARQSDEDMGAKLGAFFRAHNAKVRADG